MPLPELCRADQNEVAEGPQNAGLVAHAVVKMRHSPEVLD
jgi:hypothetical protein